MRFDPAKAWPHPVLRPPIYGDDYPNAEFEVDIECRRAEGGTSVHIQADFVLSEPDLLQLVADERAVYVLVVRSPSTFFRREVRSMDPTISATFSGELSGQVEFSPYLVAVADMDGFHVDGWHGDFDERSFDIRAGVVLAEDVPKHYWIDFADEAYFGAAMTVVQLDGMADTRWTVNLEEHRIQIQLSPGDYAKFRRARDASNNTPDGQYLLNGLYLPALVATLEAADRNPDAYTEYRWYATLSHRLDDLNCEPIGSERVGNRAEDAQKVFDSPFVKMPMIAVGD